MAAANVSAFKVGTMFINQYYPILTETPDTAYMFYNDSSTVTWIDGDDTQTVSSLRDIHSLLTSLNAVRVEVRKLTSQNSWNGGFLLFVTGVVRSGNFSGKRNFTQTFFLAPQDSGYFVQNDILHFDNEVIVNQHPLPGMPDIRVDSEAHESNPHREQQVSNNELEEETREYVNSLHIEEDSPVDKYSLPDEQHDEELQSESIVEEAPVSEFSPDESVVDVNQVEAPASVPVSVEEPAAEPVGEPAKVSYASILRVATGQFAGPVAPRPSVRQSMPPPPPEQSVQASAQQLNPAASSFVPEAADTAAVEARDDVLLTSVFVKSLPSNVTNADLEKEFRKFGKIKPNGVFIRNKKEIGVCFAFVEFEDIYGAQNAIKASSIELLGRQIYIEERNPTSTSSSRGGAVGRGRGRGSYQSEASRERGGNSYNSVRGNGYQHRTYQ